MAIVDGKRIKGWMFYKMRGRREWVAHNIETSEFFSLVVGYDGDTPLESRFYYCSGTKQRNFLAYGHYMGALPSKKYIQSSWQKMPEGWRELFRQDVFTTPKAP